MPDRLGALDSPANPFHAGRDFGAALVRYRYNLLRLLAPLTDQTWNLAGSQAHGRFYGRASGGSVTLPAAGYDYDVNWAIYVDGFFLHWTSS
jgi:hypothetical protein